MVLPSNGGGVDRAGGDGLDLDDRRHAHVSRGSQVHQRGVLTSKTQREATKRIDEWCGRGHCDELDLFEGPLTDFEDLYGSPLAG